MREIVPCAIWQNSLKYFAINPEISIFQNKRIENREIDVDQEIFVKERGKEGWRKMNVGTRKEPKTPF